MNVKWDIETAEKGGYDHFMLKEIHEQPKAIRDTLSGRLKDGEVDLSNEVKLTKEQIQEIEKIHFVACGTAYHAGLVGKYVLEDLARIPVEVDVASEYRYRNPLITEKTLVVVISQSGKQQIHWLPSGRRKSTARGFLPLRTWLDPAFPGKPMM